MISFYCSRVLNLELQQGRYASHYLLYSECEISALKKIYRVHSLETNAVAT